MKNKFICDCEQIHEENVRAAEKGLPGMMEINLLSNLFKQIADPTRLKLLLAVSHQELCVCDLAVLLSMTKSAVSHQLRYLREANLVRFRKEGKNTYYALQDECVEKVIEEALRHIQHRAKHMENEKENGI